jgi:hypothetical protein
MRGTWNESAKVEDHVDGVAHVVDPTAVAVTFHPSDVSTTAEPAVNTEPVRLMTAKSDIGATSRAVTGEWAEHTSDHRHLAGATRLDEKAPRRTLVRLAVRPEPRTFEPRDERHPTIPSPARSRPPPASPTSSR